MSVRVSAFQFNGLWYFSAEVPDNGILTFMGEDGLDELNRLICDAETADYHRKFWEAVNDYCEREKQIQIELEIEKDRLTVLLRTIDELNIGINSGWVRYNNFDHFLDSLVQATTRLTP